MTIQLARAFEVSLNAAEWSAVAAGDARLAIASESRAGQPALRLDYDFKGAKGFVVARCPLQNEVSEEYAVAFRLRGTGPTNSLEIKLVDTTGQNVWRHVETNLRPPARWKRFRVDNRQFEFAWGPASGDMPKHLGAIELAIVAGEGGAGTLWVSGLGIENQGLSTRAQASASSALPHFEAQQALGGSGWIPRRDDARPWIVVDFIEVRRLGGLIIDWREGAPASGFRLRASSRGERWRTVYGTARAGGARSYVYLPNLQTRLLRLEFDAPVGGAALQPQSFEFSRSIETFWYGIARHESRGCYPRWLHREQTLWTPIGTANGRHCALMNEEGAVEIAPGSFSIEPMLAIDDRLVTWDDVAQRQELRDGVAPVPVSIWETETWRLHVEGEATRSGRIRVRYRLENRSNGALSARLLVLVRPFQVTPPWQSVGRVGGVSRIHDVAWEADALLVNHTDVVVPASVPDGFAATTFDEGFVAAHLAEHGREHARRRVHDAFGFASGALTFDLPLAGLAVAERSVECAPGNGSFAMGEPAFDWSKELPSAQWSGSGWAMDAVRAALTATAHILVTRSGAALQPGPRRYARSWIRDASVMSAALLRMGHVEEVVEFIRWYAPHQRADGFVPCCVDIDGPDWLVEHDSHGQLIAVIADCHGFKADPRFLAECWPYVVKAVGCIENLLDETGLLPVSVSHEGYLAQPVHSYWDDFWALRGLRDAVELAREMGDHGAAAHWHGIAKRFASAVFQSIERTRAAHALDFIPGSVEWADFDPTATANAIALLDVVEGLDRDALDHTFDRYLDDWRRKRSGAVQWVNYSPYEIRIVGALVRLERREAALELLRFFLSDRRPPAWNQWPEIAWRDRRAPAHVGDLPHTWVAAEYVLAVRTLFAYERAADGRLVVGAGLAPEWTSGSGVHVRNMPTPYGSLSFSARTVDEHTFRCEIEPGAEAGIELRPPLSGRITSVRVNGRNHQGFDAHSVFISSAPAEIVCHVDSAALHGN
ncbi:MAG TPA: discoidin domain-containing protein [Casimicrobiaceae bacterium]|nr:discoidin domain-containing protein [Casimicrobiaceae bacterium]